jgi:hypothetical protein
MKLGFATCLACALLLIGGAAEANDKMGRFGLGGDTTLTGDSGVSARYQVSPQLGLGMILFYQRDAFTEGDEDVSGSQAMLSLRGNFDIAGRGASSLGIVGGIDVFRVAFEGDSESEIALEGGFHIEHGFTDFFTMHVELGLIFALFADGGMGGGDDGTTVIIGEGSTFAQAGGGAQ